MIYFTISEEPIARSEPYVILYPTSWDDYSYRTEFAVQVYIPEHGLETIGQVKILARNYPESGSSLRETFPLLPTKFEALPEGDFCSLGQSSLYYQRLASLPDELGMSIVQALNDVSFTTSNWWRQLGGFDTSLLRTSAAHIAYRDAKALMRKESPKGDVIQRIRFQRAYGVYYYGGPETAEFEFDGGLQIPGRLNVLVGKNGVGKTSLLQGMTSWFGQIPGSGKFDYIPQFSRVLFVSFNAHDDRIRMGFSDNVRYVGARPADRAVEKLLGDLEELKSVSGETWRERLLKVFPDARSMAQGMLGVNNESEHIAQLRDDPDWAEFLPGAFDEGIATELRKDVSSALSNMSAGQRVLAGLYAALFAQMDRQSLVLIDEPENHLHPSLIALFIRNLNDLLVRRRSFGIIATHSPIIVQETPARFVQILEREGNQTSVRSPMFETFGESIDVLTSRLFDTDFRSSHWKKVIRELVEEGRSMDEIERIVGGKELPMLAKSYAAFFLSQKESKP